MNPHINSQQMILLAGVAVLVIVVLIMAVYLLQKTLGRGLKSDESTPTRVRLEGDAGFALTTVQGVIAELKSDQKATQEKLVAAERRADENAHKFELLARELDCGLMIFDPAGYVTFSNPLARQLLAVDTWARRRYGEILQDISELSQIIGECFDLGTETRKKPIQFQGADGTERHVEVSVLPTRDRAGAVEVVACIVRDRPPSPPAT
jgi:PAS domain-containing protein